MKNNTSTIILTIIVLVLGWKNYIPKNIITGKYVNNNTEPTLEGPSSIFNGKDTLILFDNQMFESKTWGTGTYKVKLGFWEKTITLNYNNKMASYTSHLKKSFTGKSRIMLSLDHNFYFEKID